MGVNCHKFAYYEVYKLECVLVGKWKKAYLSVSVRGAMSEYFDYHDGNLGSLLACNFLANFVDFNISIKVA
jgi:hypothetical protein